MVHRIHFRLTLLIFILIALIFTYPAFAEIKVFEKEVEAIVGEGQAQSQVESFALQRAKRLAVEEAGTYLSSLTVVKNYQLQKDEVTALASGIVRSVPVGLASIREANGVTYVKIKARIEVDTSILERDVKDIMKKKGTLKKLEETQQKVRELEDELKNVKSNSKSAELKRLEEMNAQAMALERERDSQRLFREEQALKAKGELSRVEADRFAKDRERQDRISKTLAEQEKAKREEAAAMAAEQDRIKRAQLENEQRWNDLARKAQVAQDQWGVIDDSLSLKQAVSEVKDLKREIANLKNRLDFQYNENTKNLQAAYAQQRTLTAAKLPPAPAPKDAFESTSEYNSRIMGYHMGVKERKKSADEAMEILNREEVLKLAETKVDYLGQQIRVFLPFIQRLHELQARKFAFPEGGAITVELGEPDADNERFPLRLQYDGKSWSEWWNYTDRNAAKDFYRTRTYLKTEGLFQIEEAEKLSPTLTAVRVTHLGTKEVRQFELETPRMFAEIAQFDAAKRQHVSAEKEGERAALAISRSTIIDKDGRFIAYVDGTVLDTQTNLMWAGKDSGDRLRRQKGESLISAASADQALEYCKIYRGGGYTDWRLPTLKELSGLFDRGLESRIKGSVFDTKVHITKLIEITHHEIVASEMKSKESGHSCFLGTCTTYYTYYSSLFDFASGNTFYDIKGSVLPVRSAKNDPFPNIEKQAEPSIDKQEDSYDKTKKVKKKKPKARQAG